MQTDPTPLDERLQRMVNLKVPGIDIMHGELKMRMLEAEAELNKLRSDMRSRSVKDVLASKGVSDKLAKLIPSDVDTPEQIDAWLNIRSLYFK